MALAALVCYQMVMSRCCVIVFFILIDTDECVSDPCHANATCNNTPGNFTCTCHDGLRGDGFTCILLCDNGFQLSRENGSICGNSPVVKNDITL